MCACASRALPSSPQKRGVRRGAHADRRGREPLCSWSWGEPFVHGRASDPGWPEAALRPLLPALWTRHHSQDHAARAGLAQEPQSGSCCRDRRGTAVFTSQTQVSVHVLPLTQVLCARQTAEWCSRAQQFDSACDAVVQMFNRLSNAPNRSILYDLYNYICDIKSGVGLARAYVKTLGEETFPIISNQARSHESQQGAAFRLTRWWLILPSLAF